MQRTLLFSGFDLLAPELPDSARVLLPPIPLPELSDFRDAASVALDEPLEGEPLAKRVNAGSRVTVVIDDLNFPVPAVRHDCRRELLEATLAVLAAQGLRSSHVKVVVANGLSRKWRPSELAEVLGVQSTASYPVSCHDADAQSELSRLGEDENGPVEFNRAVAEADLIVHLNLVTQPLHAGLFSLAAGTSGYRTARSLYSPSLFSEDGSPLVRGSAYHRAHEALARKLTAKVPVLQLSAVLNNELWPPALAQLLRSEDGLGRPLQMWNALPLAVRHRMARMMRASYRPISVLSGPPDAVAPAALALFLRQHEVTTHGEADVLLFGLPDLGPSSVGTAQNPVLAATLALGFVGNLVTGRPLLKKGGVLIFANGLSPTFHKAHAPHQQFYERALRVEREPEALHERFEAYFSHHPDFMEDYSRRFAFHGAHPLFSWTLASPVRRRAGRVIVAQGDPRSCNRLGFTPASSIEDALRRAGEHLGEAQPKIAVLELPPPFFVKVEG